MSLMNDELTAQINAAQVALVCWLDNDGGAHFIGAGTEQPLSRLKVMGLLEATKMMVADQIRAANLSAESLAQQQANGQQAPAQPAA